MRHTGSLLVALLAHGCAPPCSLESLCDIREAECQESIARAVGCVRRTDAIRVDINVVDATTVIDAKVAEQPTPEEQQRSARWLRALALYRLAPSGATTESVQRQFWDSVAGFYESDDDSITVLDRGRPLDDVSRVMLLAHEIVHALQDREGLFEHRNPAALPGLDSFLARRAVTEGEAKLYEDLVYLRTSGWHPREVDWHGAFQRWQQATLEESRQTQNPYVLATMTFPYAFGSGYVYEAWIEGGAPGLRAVYDDLPVSVREVRAGYNAAPAEPWVEDMADSALPVLPDDYQLSDWTRMGTWILGAFCQRLAIAGVDCDGLLDDVFSVFHDQISGATVAFWRLRFSSTGEAERFAIEVRQVDLLYIDTWTRDRDTVLVMSNSLFSLPDLELLAWGAIADVDTTGDGSSSRRPAMFQSSAIACPHSANLSTVE